MNANNPQITALLAGTAFDFPSVMCYDEKKTEAIHMDSEYRDYPIISEAEATRRLESNYGKA